MQLQKRISINVIWNFCDQILRRGIGTIVTLILARFLTPDAYGLFAMLALFIELGNWIMNAGIKDAVIRHKYLYPIYLNTAFYANIGLAAFSYCLLFLFSPLIADFYDEPRLTLLIRVASVCVFIGAFQTVQSAILIRAINFKIQMRIAVPAAGIAGGVAIVAAIYGAGVWALIISILIAPFITTFLLWRWQRWRPSVGFSVNALKDMFGFGSWIFLTGVLDTVFKHSYVIVIAKLFNPSLAGLYFFSNNLKELLFNQLVTSVQLVTYPAMATIQDDDRKLKDNYRRLIQVLTFITFPIVFFFAALAEPIIHTVLPEKWYGVVPFLQMLFIAGVFFPLQSVNSNILKVKDRTRELFYIQVLNKIIISIILLLSIPYGIWWILVGQVVAGFFTYIPSVYITRSVIAYNIREQLGDYSTQFTLSLLIAGLGYYLVGKSRLSDIYEIITVGILMTLIYMGASFVFNKSQLGMVIKILSQLKKRTD